MSLDAPRNNQDVAVAMDRRRAEAMAILARGAVRAADVEALRRAFQNGSATREEADA